MFSVLPHSVAALNWGKVTEYMLFRYYAKTPKAQNQSDNLYDNWCNKRHLLVKGIDHSRVQGKWEHLARNKLAKRQSLHVAIVKTKYQVIMKGWKGMTPKLLHQHCMTSMSKVVRPPKALNVPQLTLPGEDLGEALFDLVARLLGC